MGVKTFPCKGPHLFLVGWPACRTCKKERVSGVDNRLNYCVIVMVHTQFKNVVGVCKIQVGWPLVGDQWFNPLNMQT